MPRLPVCLHAIAFFIALFVQTLATPLAGAWVFFHVAACCCAYRSGEPRNSLWFFCLLWLLTLGVSTFLLAPVPNGAVNFWFLSAMPMVALCVRRADLPDYLDAFLAILIVFACGLILQMMLRVQFTLYNYAGFAWPMLDPNNAAAVLNAGLIPSFYMALRKPKWFVPFGIFALAMIATYSKAGALAGIICCLILLYERFGSLPILLLLLPAFMAADYVVPRLIKSFADRVTIWKQSLPLLFVHPLTGLGLGSFGHFYRELKPANSMDIFYAHNDLLQLTIEGGILLVLAFVFLGLKILNTTGKKNLVSGCVLLAVFLQSMVEFQFYVPAVSLLAGLALAYHQLTYGGPKLIVRRPSRDL